VSIERTWERDGLTYFGRNGTGICRGLYIATGIDDDSVTLAPINSKGDIARCRIDVPKTDLVAAVASLDPMLQEARAILQQVRDGVAPEECWTPANPSLEFKVTEL